MEKKFLSAVSIGEGGEAISAGGETLRLITMWDQRESSLGMRAASVGRGVLRVQVRGVPLARHAASAGRRVAIGNACQLPVGGIVGRMAGGRGGRMKNNSKGRLRGGTSCIGVGPICECYSGKRIV